MAKMIQVRNVPDAVHKELVRRARTSGVPLTEYIAGILRLELSRPPKREVFARVARADRVDLGQPAADLIREQRRQR